MNIIAWLRTPIATLIVLCSALLAQLPHAADVFRLIVVGEGWWPTVHSYTYAIALELAVLLFVVQRRNIESYAFAGVSILVNLSYYHLHGVQLLSVAALPAWLVSIALPAAIAQYSHLIAAATDAQDDASATPAATPARTATPPSATDVAPASTATLVATPDDARGSAAQPDARAVALQMAAEGCGATQIAMQTGANINTVRAWLSRERARRNGGTHA